MLSWFSPNIFVVVAVVVVVFCLGSWTTSIPDPVYCCTIVLLIVTLAYLPRICFVGTRPGPLHESQGKYHHTRMYGGKYANVRLVLIVQSACFFVRFFVTYLGQNKNQGRLLATYALGFCGAP